MATQRPRTRFLSILASIKQRRTPTSIMSAAMSGCWLPLKGRVVVCSTSPRKSVTATLMRWRDNFTPRTWAALGFISRLTRGRPRPGSWRAGSSPLPLPWASSCTSVIQPSCCRDCTTPVTAERLSPQASAISTRLIGPPRRMLSRTLNLPESGFSTAFALVLGLFDSGIYLFTI